MTGDPVAGSSLWCALPELVLVLAASLMLAVDCVVRQTRVVAAMAVAAGLAAVCLSAGLYRTAEPVVAFDGLFVLDGYASFFKILFLVSCLLVLSLSLRRQESGEYSVLLVIATAGMMLMVSAADLIVLYLGLELMALSTSVLVGLRSRSSATEAAMKYFLLGGFSSAFLLYGIALTYGITGTTEITLVAAAWSPPSAPGALVPLILLIVGLAFKVAAVPFHMWAPDVYQGAPTAVTAFLSVGPKAAAFAVLGRVVVAALHGADTQWEPLLAVLAVLSIAVGNLVALVQTDLKRLLAYSSIAHAGYAMLGPVAGGREGLASMMVYLLIYSVMNLGAFGVLVLIESEDERGPELDDVRGLATRRPAVALAMLVFMFSLVGIPPTAGFVGKLAIFMALVRAGHAALAVVAVIFSVVSAFFYLRVVTTMYMRRPTEDGALALSIPVGFAVATTTAAVIAFGVFPGPLIALAELSVASFGL
jgi:NADH-quinone oxidoreductase subunit N